MPVADTQTRIAHSTECDERGKEQRKRRQRAQRSPYRFDIQQRDQSAEHSGEQQASERI